MMRAVSLIPALAGLILAGGALADERVPFTMDVEDATAPVGEKTEVTATITAPEGYRLTKVYRHRVIDLSAFEDKGVEFEDRVVVGSMQDDGSVVFNIGVTPTEPGEHPINGLIRVSFINESKTESKSVPLMATVIGKE